MKNIVQRLLALGLRKPLAEKLEILVTKWASASGPEWTVKRLKSLKVELISTLAGSEVRAPWVARNRAGLPKGPIAELFRMASTKKGRFLAINSLMIYSAFVSDSITESQRQKFFGSMESKDPTGCNLGPARAFKVGHIEYVFRPVPWVNYRRSASSFQPGPDGKSYPETDTFIDLAFALASEPILVAARKWNNLFAEAVPAWLFQDHDVVKAVALKYAKKPVTLCVGKISYIQEPGFKLRAVANPNRVLQTILDPLKRALGDVVKKLPNDYTFDQDAGVKVVQGWLKEGKTVHSIDLSDATNLFPRSYTFACLRSRLSVRDDDRDRYQQLLELFEFVSGSPWYTKEGGVIRTHRFTRGQPLGLGPSFFAFAISHNVLLQDICKDLQISPEGVYCVLGDDVVISDAQVAIEYRKKLSQLGCKISEEKSLVSSSVAEFAGRVIMADDNIPCFKWRALDDTNIVDFCRNVGPSSVILLSDRQARLIAWLGDIPDFLGGMGWNPFGLSLEQRLNTEKAQYILQREHAVMLPFRRVDVGLVEVANDKRLLELSPKTFVYGSDNGILPSQANPRPRWGSPQYWVRYRAAQDMSNVLPPTNFALEEGIPSDANEGPWRYEWLYTPYVKDVADPTTGQHVPWFDILRYFDRNQSRLVSRSKS